MATEKIGKTSKRRDLSGGIVDGLFEEVQEELNEDTKKDAKVKIKDLLLQKTKAEKIVKNLDRQIEDLKIQIGNELG